MKDLPLSDWRSILDPNVIFSDLVQCSDHFSGSLANFTAGVEKIGGDGVIANRLSSHSEP